MRIWSRHPPSPRNSAPAGYGLAGVLFAASSLALAWPWLSGSVTIPYDAKAHFFPQFAFLANALHAGQSPFWTPNVFTGWPQIADPQSLIFAPAFFVAAWFVPEPGFVLADALVFGSLAAGGGALMLFFRDRGWHAAGALVAALAFAFGGSAAWRVQHVGQVLSLAWFPFVLFALSRALDRGSIAWGAAAGVFGGFLLLGRDQVALIEIYMLSIYALLHMRKRPLSQSLPPLAAGFVTGSIVALIPLLLTLALTQDSNRPAIDLASAFMGSLHPASLLTLASANLFGSAGPLAGFWGPPSPIWGETNLYLARNMTTLYMGALVLVAPLAILVTRSIVFWRDADARFFAVAVLVLGTFAVGKYAPVFPLLDLLPGMNLFRRPADASFSMCACLAILAGFAVHECVRVPPPRIALVTVVAVAIALCIATAIAKGKVESALPAIGISALFLSLSAFLLRWFRAMPRAAALVACAALLTTDLAIGNAPNESTALPPSDFEFLRTDTRNATITTLREKLTDTGSPDRRDRVELAGLGFAWPNAPLVQNFDHDLGYNPLRTSLFEKFTGAGDHLALPEQRFFSKAFPSYRSPAADITGLRWIATGVPVEQIDKSLKPGDLNFVARTPDAYIYENPRALPRVLLATRAIAIDFKRLLDDGQWPDVDYATTVLLEAPREAETQRKPGTAKFARYDNTQIDIDADAPDGGWLVLNDIWHPWWTATVDGAPTEILHANGAFRAVTLAPGQHRVRFTFQPFTKLLHQFAGPRERTGVPNH